MISKRTSEPVNIILAAIKDHENSAWIETLDKTSELLKSKQLSSTESKIIIEAYLEALSSLLKNTNKNELILAIKKVEKAIVAHSLAFAKFPQAFEKLIKRYRRAYEKYSDQLGKVSTQLFLEYAVPNPKFVDTHKMIEDRIANYTANLTTMMETEIVECENDDERTIVMERWVGIMRHRFNSGDYLIAAYMFSIFKHNQAVSRLARTLSGLSMEAHETIDMVETWLNKGGNRRAELMNTRDKAIIAPIDYFTAQLGQAGEQLEVYRDMQRALELEHKDDSLQYGNLLADIKKLEESKSKIDHQILEMQLENLLQLLDKRLKRKEREVKKSKQIAPELIELIGKLKAEKTRLKSTKINLLKELRQNKLIFTDSERLEHLKAQVSANGAAIQEVMETIKLTSEALDQKQQKLSAIEVEIKNLNHTDVSYEEKLQKLNSEKETIKKSIAKLQIYFDQLSVHLETLKQVDTDLLKEACETKEFAKSFYSELTQKTSAQKAKAKNEQNYRLSLQREPRINDESEKKKFMKNRSTILVHLPAPILGNSDLQSNAKKLEKLNAQKDKLESSLRSKKSARASIDISSALRQTTKEIDSVKFSSIRLQLSEASQIAGEKFQIERMIMESNFEIKEKIKSILDYVESLRKNKDDRVSLFTPILDILAKPYDHVSKRAEKGSIPDLDQLIINIQAEIKDELNKHLHLNSIKKIIGKNSTFTNLLNELLVLLQYQANLNEQVKELDKRKDELISCKKPIARRESIYTLFAPPKITGAQENGNLLSIDMEESITLLSQLGSKSEKVQDETDVQLDQLKKYEERKKQEEENPKELKRSETTPVKMIRTVQDKRLNGKASQQNRNVTGTMSRNENRLGFYTSKRENDSRMMSRNDVIVNSTQPGKVV